MIHPDEENMFCVHQQTELFLFNIFLNYYYVHQTQKNVFMHFYANLLQYCKCN